MTSITTTYMRPAATYSAPLTTSTIAAAPITTSTALPYAPTYSAPMTSTTLAAPMSYGTTYPSYGGYGGLTSSVGLGGYGYGGIRSYGAPISYGTTYPSTSYGTTYGTTYGATTYAGSTTTPVTSTA